MPSRVRVGLSGSARGHGTGATGLLAAFDLILTTRKRAAPDPKVCHCTDLRASHQPGYRKSRWRAAPFSPAWWCLASGGSLPIDLSLRNDPPEPALMVVPGADARGHTCT